MFIRNDYLLIYRAKRLKNTAKVVERRKSGDFTLKQFSIQALKVVLRIEQNALSKDVDLALQQNTKLKLHIIQYSLRQRVNLIAGSSAVID